jgi:hypothetical protein
MRWLLPLWAACALAEPQILAPGLKIDFHEDPQGPWRYWVLRLDPKQPNLNIVPMHARDRAMGLETVAEMASRYGATAAINGGYFSGGTYAGVSANHFAINKRIFGTAEDHSALVLCEETKGVERAAVGMAGFEGTVKTPRGATFRINGVNRERRAQELILYTPDLGPSTLTKGGFEVSLSAKGQVLATSDAGNTPIPVGGKVLSGSGGAADWLRQAVTKDRKLQIDTRLVSDASCPMLDLIGGGPRIVRNGQPDLSETGFRHANVRHPRTVAGIQADGTILFVILDGRRLNSVGMTLAELANLMIHLGAVEAVNLDGGGSSTMWAAGHVWNTPSDGRPRPVSDALLVFSIHDWSAVRSLIERWDPAIITPAAQRRLLGNIGNRNAFLRAVQQGGISNTALRVLQEAADALE